MEDLCKIRDVYRAIAEFETQFMQQYNLSLNEGMLLCTLLNTPRLTSGEIAGIGVNIFPEGAYPGRRRLCPPACSRIRFSVECSVCWFLYHSRRSQVVPPPDPSFIPIGSDVQNHSVRSTFSSS